MIKRPKIFVVDLFTITKFVMGAVIINFANLEGSLKLALEFSYFAPVCFHKRENPFSNFLGRSLLYSLVVRSGHSVLHAL